MNDNKFHQEPIEATKAVPKIEVPNGELKRKPQRPANPPPRKPQPESAVRRRRRPTGLLGGVLYFALIVGISLVLAWLLWKAANDVLSLDKPFAEATIDIEALDYDRGILTAKLDEYEISYPQSASVNELLRIFDDNGKKRPNAPFDFDSVVKQLKEQGIIEYEWLFKVFAKVASAESKIEPGVYQLDSTLDYRAVVSSMKHNSGARPVVNDVLIPEGYTCKQIFALLEQKKVCSVKELNEAAANYQFKYSFLDGLPYGDANRLEGFLFPDTYSFYQGSSGDEAIKKFLNNFDKKFTQEMRDTVAAQGKSIKEVLTVAALIEREAANDKERPTIASVIFNRLNNWSNPLLQIDASIQHALPEHKPVINAEDLQLDSPYNTYKYAGLPPGPIANPGVPSIKAALAPASTNYYFYALGKDESHHFFKTEEEHRNFVASSEFINN
ncbi:MAG: endolytic transglycosylase MltG [Oscillospiraceae bacterium]|jgi:UPF0755 protein|nr:endolytic transglycosylase MltG [Oscillospiraceae bacterium]